MIDYQSIVENLRDEDVFRLLEQLGAEPVDRGAYFVCKTVCHNGDADEASAKLYYYKNSHLFVCYTECGNMSIFKFLKNYYDARDIVYDWHRDIFQVILNCSASITRAPDVYRSRRGEYEKQDVRDLPTYPKGILEMFQKYYPVEWLNDGISREAMDKYDIRYSSSWNKIIIPHFNAAGAMIGIRGRALNPQEAEEFGKYVPVQIEGKWYSHPLSLNLCGLDKNKENIKKTGKAYLFEAEKSVLQLEGFDMINCGVATCGSNLNKYQIKLLMKECSPREIIVCYDNEEEGKSDKYFNKLYEMCKKYSNYANMSFIYDRKGLSKLKDSPSDNGQEVFEQLLKSRVRV
jgi:hypothetical protein